VQVTVEVDDKFVEVPLLDVRASMGPGALQMFDDEVVQLIRLSKDWVLQNFRGASIKSLAIITAKGDSMSPTYEDGSVLLVNTAKQVIDVEGVYVMARGGELFVKRMLRRVSGGYTMISDNHAYPPQAVQEEELDQLKVLGKVLVALTPKRL
jgi:phage repressor protein C with HTH and peptisase S24 domain